VQEYAEYMGVVVRNFEFFQHLGAVSRVFSFA